MRLRTAMRLYFKVFLLFLLVGVSPRLAAPVFAQGTRSAPEVRAATADLNGDGKQEKITLSYTGQNPVRFTLSVNGRKFVNNADSFTDETPGFRIVKIDGASRARQISVRFLGPNDYGETRFFRWDGKTLRLIGTVPNAEEVSGNGAVYASVWMDFWRCTQKFAFGAKTQTLAFVPQPAYYVGVPATVKSTFPIYRDHAAGSGAIASVAPGSKVQLVVFWSSAARPENSTEANRWYLIKTATGICGWAKMSAFREKVEGLPYAG